MKAAFAVWDRRIAPVFDVARQVHIVEAQGHRVVGELDAALPEGIPAQRVLRLAELGIDTLVCGAISRSTQALIASYGIRVWAFVAGELDDVVQAWLASRLDHPAYAMPGCQRRRRTRCGCGGGSGRGRGADDGCRPGAGGRRRRRSSGGGLGPAKGRSSCQAEIERDPGDRAR